MTKHVVLVGMMGAGKSSVGRRVAARLVWPFSDSDELSAIPSTSTAITSGAWP